MVVIQQLIIKDHLEHVNELTKKKKKFDLNIPGYTFEAK